MAPFLTKLFVGITPVIGIQKCLLWALAFLCVASGALFSANTYWVANQHDALFFSSAAVDQLVISVLSMLLLALLIWVDYANSNDSLRTIIWDGLTPVGWLFYWLCLGGLIDNYTGFPVIIFGILAFVLQIVLVGAFVRSGLRRR